MDHKLHCGGSCPGTGTRALPSPQSLGSPPLLLTEEGGATGWTGLLAVPCLAPHVLRVRASSPSLWAPACPLMLTPPPSSRASPVAFKAPGLLLDPVALPRCPATGSSLSQPVPWEVWVPLSLLPHFSYLCPPYPRSLPLAPAEVLASL